MMKKKVLVTGSNGQLGREINFLSKIYFNYDFVFRSKSELDISKINILKKYLALNKFDFIINCAAYTMLKMLKYLKKLI